MVGDQYYVEHIVDAMVVVMLVNAAVNLGYFVSA
jgi:hypothetical protein